MLKEVVVAVLSTILCTAGFAMIVYVCRSANPKPENWYKRLSVKPDNKKKKKNTKL